MTHDHVFFVSYSFWGFTIGFFRTPWATVQTHVILGNAVNVKDNFRDLGPISSPCTERPTTHIGTTSRIILEISSAPWQILEKSYPRKIPWKEFKPSGKFKISSKYPLCFLHPRDILTKSWESGRSVFLKSLNTWSNNHGQKNMFLLKSQKASTKTLLFSWCPHQMPSKSPKNIYCILQKQNLFLKPPWNHHVIFETNLLLNQGHHHHHHRHHHRHRHRHRHHSFTVENCSFLLNWWNTII